MIELTKIQHRQFEIIMHGLKHLLSYNRIPDIDFEKYVKCQYALFHRKYSVPTGVLGNITLSTLIYSIMIFENFNRPVVLRILEYIIFFFKKFFYGHTPVMSLGIMQVQVNHFITNKKSIDLAVQIVENKYYELAKHSSVCDKLSVLDLIAKNYNNSELYSEQIVKIYCYIVKELATNGTL